MAITTIDSLQTVVSANLSDEFEVYSLSNSYSVPVEVNYTDFEGFFFPTESVTRLRSKYNELVKLFNSFKTFLLDNYCQINQDKEIAATSVDLNNVMQEMLTTANFIRDHLDYIYCTIKEEELKKAQAYNYHENTALDLGNQLRSILMTGIVNNNYGPMNFDNNGEFKTAYENASNVEQPTFPYT